MRDLYTLLSIFALLILVLPSTHASSNFTQCLADFASTNLPGGVDEHGNAVSSSEAVGLTYEVCKARCGTSSEAFLWSQFSPSFSAWLLPWLALISQLPFGAKDRLDNLMSVFLTVGSPTLAAYSLALTILNGRWAVRRLARVTYPNPRTAQNALHIFSNLQQAPMTLTDDKGLLSSLVVLPENEVWWEELSERLNYVHTWSLAAATSIVWVLVAYTFTLVDAFASLGEKSAFVDGVSDGQAIGTLWLWLLPIVIGWLQVSPKSDHGRLYKAIRKTNELAFIAKADGGSERAIRTEAKHALRMQEDAEEDDEDAEQGTCPIYNYHRFLPWTRHVEKVVAAFKGANANAQSRKTVNGQEWKFQEKGDEDDVHDDNRKGTLPQIEEYCRPTGVVTRARWGTNTFGRFALASIIAVALQWGTASGAVIILWFTPAVGLGCRSGTYFLYASLSTLIWILLVSSSTMWHYSSQLNQATSRKLYLSLRYVGVCFRRAGKGLAIFNAIFIITTNVLQFSGKFNNCFCDVQLPLAISHMYSRAYDVFDVSHQTLESLKTAWAGGITLALSIAALFVVFIKLYYEGDTAREEE